MAERPQKANEPGYSSEGYEITVFPPEKMSGDVLKVVDNESMRSSEDTQSEILTELKRINAYLALMTDETVKDSDL